MTETSASAPSPPSRIPWEDPSVGAAAGLFRTIGMVIARPSEAFDRVGAGTGVGRPIVFGVLVGWVAIVVGAIWNALTNAMTAGLLARLSPEMARGLQGRDQAISSTVILLFVVIAGPFLVALGMWIQAALFHVALWLFRGARRPFGDTFRVVGYAQACQVFGLIPICGGLVAAIWGVVVSILGLARVHGCGTGRAAAAVLVPLVVCCACLGAFYASLIAAALSMAR